MNVEGLIETETNVDYSKKIKIFRQTNFMLCESCFWCASLLSSSSSLYYFSNDDILSKCPICNEYTLKLIPIPNISLLKKSGWPK
jgi:hypothetical protein